MIIKENMKTEQTWINFDRSYDLVGNIINKALHREEKTKFSKKKNLQWE